MDRTKPISCWTAEHSSIWNQLQLWSQKFHENRPALCKWYQHGKLRRSKQTKKLWLHLAKGAFDYCCWCDSQKIVLGTWESLAEVGAAEAVAGVDVDVVGWSWSCLSHRRRYYDTVFVSFLIIICKCLLDQPPLFIYHYSCLSLSASRLSLLRMRSAFRRKQIANANETENALEKNKLMEYEDMSHGYGNVGSM